jgi:hypothetical protein
MVFAAKLVGTVVLYLTACRASDRAPSAAVRRTAAAWGWLARRRTLAILFAFALALAASAAPALVIGLPEPGTHDEFSYLLAADTFAHGRLTNPTHPLWPHFESMHILQRPSYMSKYPPGQGLVLALGQLLTGQPIVGVWFSLALACAAICWMLRAWLPRRWALLGGVLAALALAPTSWGQSYWGGAVAALGGALLFGSLRRVLRRPRWRHGLCLGIGLTILANSRPYEGLVSSLPAAVVLAAWTWRRRRGQDRWAVVAVALPALLVLAAAGGWMAWFNYRVTGDPLRMPYQAHDAAYAAAPVFFWQAVADPPPQYRHGALRDYYAGWELPRFLRKRAGFGLNESALLKLWLFAKFFLAPAFVIPLLALARSCRDRWMGFAALTCGLTLLALTQTLYLHPHYLAPVTGLVFALAAGGLRYLQPWQWRGRPVGRRLVGGTVALHVAFVGLPVLTTALLPTPALHARAELLARLQGLGGRHLVVVRYGPAHCCHDEWVYNAADIDGAPVVWAREMDSSDNRALLDYFKDRQAWLLEVDEEPAPLRPYPQPDQVFAKVSGVGTKGKGLHSPILSPVQPGVLGVAAGGSDP